MDPSLLLYTHTHIYISKLYRSNLHLEQLKGRLRELKKMSHLFIFVLLLSLGITSGSDPGLQNVRLPLDRSKAALGREVRVEIMNSLPDNMELTVHCKSKDDDLGFHKLLPFQTFEFRFKPNFWRTTLFFCSFQWTGAFHYYDVYIHGRESRICDHCIWHVTPGGPCLYNTDKSNYNYCAKWNPPSLA